MDIVIVGMGEVGKHIATVFLEEAHDVVIVDQSSVALAAAEEKFDAMVLQGHGGSRDTLRKARVEKADLFIAVTNNDEVNLLAALQAKQFGAKRTIARVSNESYFDGERGLHRNVYGFIDLVINPTVLVAIEIHKLVRIAGAVAVEDFADNRIEMVQLPVESIDSYLRDLNLPSNTLVAAIERDGELIVPSGADRLQPGDEVLCVGKVEQIPKVERMFNRERKRFLHKVFIVGGTQIGEHLARTLANDGIQVVLIEQDRRRCYELVELLGDGVTVLNGDGTDTHLLEEERVERADAFIAASGQDELNLMAALLAKDLGVRRCLALVHKPDYASVCERLGVDVSLSPRLTVAREVLKYARSGQVESIRPVLEGRGEFLEFIAVAGSRISGKPIKESNFPRGANICAVLGENGAYVPRGDDVIHAGDRVVVFTTPNLRARVEHAFQRPRRLL